MFNGGQPIPHLATAAATHRSPEQAKLVELVLDVHDGRLDLERPVAIEHDRDVLLAADLNGTVGRALLLLDVVSRVGGAEPVERVLGTVAVAAPCCTIYINRHGNSPLVICSTAHLMKDMHLATCDEARSRLIRYRIRQCLVPVTLSADSGCS